VNGGAATADDLDFTAFTLDGGTAFDNANTSPNLDANQVVAVTDGNTPTLTDLTAVAANVDAATTQDGGTAGDDRSIILYDNGTDTGIYQYVDGDTNDTVDAGELTLIGIVSTTADATTFAGGDILT
jgi:hypothetical protein